MTGPTFAESAALIVRRTAKYGLIESQESNEKFEKWFYIWIGDVVGELGEFISSGEDIEAGDVVWGIIALCLLLEINPESVLAENSDDCFSGLQIVLIALELLEHGKKIARDGLSIRKIDYAKVLGCLRQIYSWVSINVNGSIEEALALVDQKLQSRYPNGYNPEDSVNR